MSWDCQLGECRGVGLSVGLLLGALLDQAAVVLPPALRETPPVPFLDPQPLSHPCDKCLARA